MTNHFNKELLITKEDDKSFEKSTKFWICDNAYADGTVKVKDHCHITRNHRESGHGCCNIKVNLNQKIPVVFHNLINYESHPITQETSKLNFKINVFNF